jgi:hypothetical protein
MLSVWIRVHSTRFVRRTARNAVIRCRGYPRRAAVRSVDNVMRNNCWCFGGGLLDVEAIRSQAVFARKNTSVFMSLCLLHGAPVVVACDYCASHQRCDPRRDLVASVENRLQSTTPARAIATLTGRPWTASRLRPRESRALVQRDDRGHAHAGITIHADILLFGIGARFGQTGLLQHRNRGIVRAVGRALWASCELHQHRAGKVAGVGYLRDQEGSLFVFEVEGGCG